jgi:hypothetical protein
VLWQVWEVKFETERAKPDSESTEIVLVAVSRVSIMVIPPEDNIPKDTTPKEPMKKQFAG